jgi:hypothetical protein
VLDYDDAFTPYGATVFSIVFVTRYSSGSTADIHFYDLLQFRVGVRLYKAVCATLLEHISFSTLC